MALCSFAGGTALQVDGLEISVPLSGLASLGGAQLGSNPGPHQRPLLLVSGNSDSILGDWLDYLALLTERERRGSGRKLHAFQERRGQAGRMAGVWHNDLPESG